MKTIEGILAKVKPLAVEYYHLTGKPLGVTGEIGEFEVARLLGLKLEPPRTEGYDATDAEGCRYQIKARAFGPGQKPGGQIGSFNNKEWDAALLAIMDRQFKIVEIWEADRNTIDRELDRPGSKARNDRRQLSPHAFMKIGHLRYSANMTEPSP